MKKWLIGGGILAVLVVTLLVGSMAMSAFAQTPTSPQVTITPEQAKAAALAANPGATAVEVDLDRENGAQVYEVKLDNGLEMKVDAGNGAILSIEQEDADEAAGDLDNVQEEVESQAEDADEESGDVDDLQEEFESQADDALEMPHAEDAPGQ
jgi:hypothetical protein